jgi:hypothetical protein
MCYYVLTGSDNVPRFCQVRSARLYKLHMCLTLSPSSGVVVAEGCRSEAAFPGFATSVKIRDLHGTKTVYFSQKFCRFTYV